MNVKNVRFVLKCRLNDIIWSILYLLYVHVIIKLCHLLQNLIFSTDSFKGQLVPSFSAAFYPVLFLEQQFRTAEIEIVMTRPPIICGREDE